MGVIDEANRDLEALLQKCKVTDAKIKSIQEFEPVEGEKSVKIYTKGKCKNCGKIFVLDEPEEVNLSKDEIIEFVTSNKITNVGVCIHTCENGELGIVDGIALIVRE